MTYRDISKKLLRLDFHRYRLYFLCNLSAAALFCCFAVIFFNRTFMNGQIVNTSISGNIYLPGLMAAVFLFFFLPFSSQAFLDARKQAYGVMFSLGMSRKEAFRNLIFENFIVSLSALLAALVAGTVLSFLFFVVIIYGIGVEGIRWQLSPEAYGSTALLYAAAMAAAFPLNAWKLVRDEIGNLLKAQYKLEKIGHQPGHMNRYLLAGVFVRRHKRAWSLRYVSGSLIVAVAVMLAGSCAALCPAFLKDAKAYAPYDMVYSEIYGMNQVPLQRVIRILEENDVVAEQVIRIAYVRDSCFNYFPVSELNRSLGCDYRLQDGTFLNLFQYDLQDGYEHDIQPVSAVTISGDRKLYSAGSDVKILFNRNAAFADRTLIVSDSDFEKLRIDATYSAGVVNLFVFKEWENSYEGICAVKDCLHDSNQTPEEEQRYFEPSSKVESVRDAEKSGRLLLFLMAFVAGLLMAAEFLLIHSRICAEQEENGRAVYSLRLLGVTDREIVRCLRLKNFLRFLPPLMAGTILSFLPSYYLNEQYGMGTLSILAGGVFGLTVTAGMTAAVFWYSKKEKMKLPN